ncbi:MAG: sugar phosphate isomerase/epimerase [Anaerolineae bacterium]|nr:sugar phosphate isomerase/epimerase [Anaerolineae bacterium]
MKLGCSTILYGGYTLGQALDGIARAGYAGIELCARPGMAPHVEMDRPDSYYLAIRDQVADRGLFIESLAGTGGISIASDAFPRVLEVAKLLGTPFVAEGAGGQAPAVEDERFAPEFQASLKGFVDILNRASAHAAAYGIKLTIKPHVGTAIYSRESILMAMQEVDREWVGINYDPSHIWRSSAPNQDPVATLEAVKPYVFTLRIRDNRASRERPIGPVEKQIPGNGALDLPALAAVMKRVDQALCATLEIVGTHGGTGYALEDVQSVVERSFAYLQPLFA